MKIINLLFKVVATSALIVFVGFVVWVSWFFYLSGTDCKSETIMQTASPNGKHLVKQEVNSCGATSSFLNKVYLDQNLIGEFESVSSTKLKFQWENDSKIRIFSEIEIDSTKIQSIHNDILIEITVDN